MFAEKLKKGDEVRIIAPSRSLAIISAETREIANKRFAELGLVLTFGQEASKEECDDFLSSSVSSKIKDLHDAFSDKRVKAVITTIGGFSANQMLGYIDWDIIKNNPKIICGYSDITILLDAIYAKTGLVTYYGPHYSSFGEKKGFEYSLEYFKKCLFDEGGFGVAPSQKWSNDDAWYEDQENRNFIDNPGYECLQSGEAEGTIIGGNLNTIGLLQGTQFLPDLEDKILFIEDDLESRDVIFDRDLQSLLHQKSADKIKGIVIGRFEKASQIDGEKLKKIVLNKGIAKDIPIVYGADFGHSEPRFTFPIGGEAKIISSKSGSSIEILSH
jgi:muramoyltetrapeptide carboxypeptidase LdcA involved in peptidoglycan recycling